MSSENLRPLSANSTLGVFIIMKLYMHACQLIYANQVNCIKCFFRLCLHYKKGLLKYQATSYPEYFLLGRKDPGHVICKNLADF